MKTKKVLRIITVIMQIASVSAIAQPSAPLQISPTNGSNGVSGTASNSFIIQWDTVPNAAYYEWVISNSHLCFKGCAGDTRDGTTVNTSAVSFNFPPNSWYYWIVRAILTTGDTTGSSPIFSFRTVSSENENPYITLSVDAASDKINIGVEWVIEPQVKELTYDLYTEAGQKIISAEKIKLKQDQAIRQEWYPITSISLQPGNYVFVFTRDINNQQITKKITVM